MTTGLSSFSSKKLPSFNINGSSSSKHIYDGVFSSPPQNKLKSSFCDNDYVEIFGSSKFDNGPWKSSCSSIPILDLPVSEQRILGSRGGIDYSDVFGGGGDERFAVDGEDLFDQLKKKAKTSSAPIPRSKGHTKEATKSDISSQSQNGQAPMNGFAKSFDSVNHLDQKNNEMLPHETKGPTHVAHFHALHEVGSSQKTQTKRGKHSRHTSSDLRVIEPRSEHDAGFLQASGLSESNSATRSHAAHQPVDVTYSATHVVDVNSIPGSIYSEPEVGPSQKTETSTTPVMRADTELGMDVHLAKKGEHSRNTSSEHGANEQKSGDDAGFQNAPGLSESNSSELSKVVKDNPAMDFHVKDDIRVEGSSDFVANKHDGDAAAASQQAPSSSGSRPTVAVKDDAEPATAFDVGKKQGKHSRMTSLDLGGYRHARDRDAKCQRKSRSGGSYSFDASHDPFTARIKVQPSKVVPSSSLPQFFPTESYCKISENSNCKSSENSSSPPPLDEQLDINSDAAVSVAALQRALEEAEIRIRLAKDFLEREGQGSTKLSFKDTLKAKVMKENRHIEDNVMQTCSLSERESVLETAHFVPVVKDPIEGENARASESIEEGDKREGGGEWEAAKHLNQLITGVKNRIASFMTWQAEAEKKEEPKESEEGEWQLKETENVTVFSGGTKLGEDNVGLIPEDTELEENESTKSNDKIDSMPDIEGPTTTNFLFFTFNSEKLRNRPRLEAEKEEAQESSEIGVDNRQEVVDENQEGLEDICMRQDCGESPIGFSNERSDEKEEELYSMAEHKRSESTHEEEHGDERSRLIDEEDNNSMNEECGSDMIELPDEVDNDRRVNEEFIHSRSELTHEEDNDRRVNEEFGGDRRKFTNEEGNDRRVNEDLGDDRRKFTDEEEIRRANEEFGDYRRKFTHEEDNDRRVNEEFVDDRRKFTDEEDNYRRVNEEYEDDRRKFTDGEDNDRRVNAEFGDDRMKFTDEEDNGRRVNEEFEDDGRKFTDEEDNDRRVNEEFEDDRRKFTDEDDNDRRVIEEFGDERRNFTDEEEIRRVNEDNGEEAIDNSHCHEDITERIDDEEDECRVVKEAEDHLDNTLPLEETNLGGETGKREEATEERYKWQECEKDEGLADHIEEVSGRSNGWEEDKRYEKQSNHTEETAMETENEVLSKAEEDCRIDGINPAVEETVFPDEQSEIVLEIADYSSDSEMDDESEKKMDTTNPSSEPEMVIENLEEERVLASVSTENAANFDGIEYLDCINGALPCEDSELHESETDLNCGKKEEPESEGISGNQAKHLHVSDHDHEEKCSVEAVHRRRRWFENGEKVDAAERPGILEGEKTYLETDQEVSEEPNLAGGVEIHADKLDSETATAIGVGIASKQKDSQVNVEATHKRRRWFVNTGEEGVPEPPSLFDGIKVTSLPHSMSDGSIDQLNTESGDTSKGKQNVETTPRRKRWFENEEKVGPAPQLRTNEDAGTTVDSEKSFKLDNMHVLEEKDDVHNKVEPVNEIDAVKKRKKEKQKERIAVERAIREARERAFAEAKERARRDAVERPNTEACQKMGSGKVSAEPSSSSSDKASMEAKLRAERAAVERATVEARERALQRALSEKTSQRSRELSGRHPTERSSSLDPKYHNSSSYSRCSDSLDKDEEFNGADGESAQRRKARLERQKRTIERAARALEEKNKLDLLAQKEQAARNMFADALDAEIKRWSSGKEGNLRALLSTLQYILGSDSGWQAISLTDLVAPTAVRKAYKKANLCVHPDKLQQRGANIQQKYVCEKVFDLLKDAWSKFNPDER